MHSLVNRICTLTPEAQESLLLTGLFLVLTIKDLTEPNLIVEHTNMNKYKQTNASEIVEYSSYPQLLLNFLLIRLPYVHAWEIIYIYIYINSPL